MDNTQKVQASSTTLTLSASIAIAVAQAMAFGHAARQATGPSRYVFRFFATTNSVGVGVLALAQAITFVLSKGVLDEKPRPNLRPVR